MDNKNEIDRVLEEGARKARALASKNLLLIKEKIGVK